MPENSRTHSRWQPAFADVILAAMMAWLFAFGGKGWGLLLSDGDTGWHIRAGEWILANLRVPHEDLFSFTRPGAPWFAWEWGADVVFHLLHQWGGLPLLAFFSGLVLIGSSLISFRWMMWRGSSALVAFPLLLLSVGGSTMHYLARPHIFTLLFVAILLWLLDSERRNPSRRIWLLVPLAVLWVNLHGGWPALFTFLGIQVAVRLLRHDPRWKTEVAVAFACAAATLLNPYGWHLHQHIFGYLGSDWIKDAVDEFQSPKFRSENLLQFEILLLGGVAAAWGRARSGWEGLVEALSVWAWAHFSLSAVRHAPIFILVGTPVLALELTNVLSPWLAAAKKSTNRGVFHSLDMDLRPKFAANSFWALILAVAVWMSTRDNWPRDFPSSLFPVATLQKIAPQAKGSRIFASDQWGDYLLYHLWPSTKAYMDGRSDFYGPELGREFLNTAAGGAGWEQTLDKHKIDWVLIPPDSDLARRITTHPKWQVIDSNKVSIALQRRSPAPAPPGQGKEFSQTH